MVLSRAAENGGLIIIILINPLKSNDKSIKPSQKVLKRTVDGGFCSFALGGREDVR